MGSYAKSDSTVAANDPAGSSSSGDVGPRVRAARVAQGMSLRELARRLDVSAGHVSQVERGLVTPSIHLLYAMADVLSLAVGDLFGEQASAKGSGAGDSGVERTEGEERFVTRASGRRTIDLESGVRWELLTPTAREPVDFREIVYPAGAGTASGTGFVRHAGREYGLVMAGILSVQLDFERYRLGPGDSIAFDSTVPHRFWNAEGETVRAVWCTVEGVPGQVCAF